MVSVCLPYLPLSFTIACQLQGLVPPSLNLVTPDVAPAHFAFATQPGTRLPEGMPVAVTNSFGFGGTYCSLAFAQDDGQP